MSYYSRRKKKKSRWRTREYIPPHAQRGLFDTTWWGQRWVEAIEKEGDPARLQRARAYAQGGNVQALHVEGHLVTAAVQGSSATPYIVEVRLLELFSHETMEDFAEFLASNLACAARLFSGELPVEVGRYFENEDLPLFPQDCEDLEVECNCEDEYQVCKHADAVGYLLGTAVDRDPLLIFELRGIDRNSLLEALVTASSPAIAGAVALVPVDAGPAARKRIAPLVGAKAEAALSSFWSGQPAVFEAAPTGLPAVVTSTPLAALPAMAFWRSRHNLADELAPISQTAAQFARVKLQNQPSQIAQVETHES